MADDITLTVRVRDLTRGDFNRLDRQLDGMKRSLNSVSRSSGDTTDEMGRMSTRLGEVKDRMAQLNSTGSLTRREMTHMQRTMGLLGREALYAAQTGGLTKDQYKALRNEISRTRLDFDALTNDIELHRNVMRDAAADAERLRRQEERRQALLVRQQQAAQRLLLQEERLRQSALQLGQAHQTSSGRTGSVFNKLIRVALMLSPALIPIAAVAVSVASKIVASFGTAAIALGAFGLALAPAFAGLMRVREAQKAYNETVDLYGASSKRARAMQGAYNRVLGTLSPEVQKAAVAFGILGTQYGSWSRSLESATVPVLTKSFAVMGSILPHLSGLVRGTSRELNRMVTIFGGAIQTPGFSRVMTQFTAFADRVMVDATHGLLGFMRALESGAIGDKFSGFISYVQEVGPAVAQTLKDIGKAFNHLVEASSDVGLSILHVVSALANIVSAVPADVLSSLLLFVFALKAVGLAAKGLAATSALIAAFKVQAIAAGTAAAASSGALVALGGAFMALSRTAKVAVIGSVVGILAVALLQLSKAGDDTAPNIDKLTSSFIRFAQTGKATGEAAKVFGADMKGLNEAIQVMTQPSTTQSIERWFSDLFGGLGEGGPDTKAAKEKLEGLDEVLTNLARSGKADIAAAGFARISSSLREQGKTTDQINGSFGGYIQTLANIKLEQELAAASMGMFGLQALDVKQKLDSQKASADGLRQSIIALNEVNLAASGAMNAMEAAIDETAAGAAGLAGKITVVGSAIDMNSESGRKAEALLRNLSATTMANAAAASDQGASWDTVRGIMERGQQQFIASATTMTGSADSARILAGAMLNIPNREVWIRMMKDEAAAQLTDFNLQVASSPGVKSIRMNVLSAMAEKVLTSLGYRVTHMPDGSVTITAIGGQALGTIGSVEAAMNRVDGMVARTTVMTVYQPSGHAGPGGFPKGAAEGGHIRGPGTSTSDSIPAMLSNNEFVIRASSVSKYGLDFLRQINEGRLGSRMRARGFAKGGGVTAEMRKERASILGSMVLSPMAKLTGSKASSFTRQFANASSVNDLISTINEWRNKIKKATSGNQEKRLLAVLTRQGNAMLKLEMKQAKLSKALDSARDKLKDLKDKAAQLAESIKDGIVGSANITGDMSGRKGTSTERIMAKLETSQQRASEFDTMLKALKARGLGGQALSEIGAAGLENGGFETATALMSASAGDLKKINTLQAQIAKSAGGAGKTVADGMYAAGVKAAEGIVKGLEKEQARINASMLSLTRGLEKALRRALGKKASGGIIGAAGGGPRGSATWVGEQGPEIVNLPYGSMVRSNPDSRRYASAAANGGRTVIEIKSSGSRVDDMLLEILRRSVRVRGGNVQVVIGGRSVG